MIHEILFIYIYEYLDSNVINHLSPDIVVKPREKKLEDIISLGNRYDIGCCMYNPGENIYQISRLATIYGYKYILIEMIHRGMNS